MDTAAADRSFWNRSRVQPGDAHGFYESYFQRANHPSRPLAFWIRNTAFSPAGRPSEAVGELWAVFVDGEEQGITAVRQEFPLADCFFSAHSLDVRTGRAFLREGRLVEGPGQLPRTLLAAHRTAFEILADRADDGVPIVA